MELLGIAQLAFRVLSFFFLLSPCLYLFSFLVGEEYGNACDVPGSIARSMSIACTCVWVCACTCIYECNVDRCMIGYVNDWWGEYLATRDSLIPFIRNARNRTPHYVNKNSIQIAKALYVLKTSPRTFLEQSMLGRKRLLSH